MSFLTLTGLTKNFGSAQVVKGFDLTVQKGEFISFLGPSGCGKTTVLRMVAGFESPTTGRISIETRDVTALPANKRNIGMVFQAYALFPNMTVAQNVGFGLKIAGESAATIKARVAEMLDLVALGALAGRYPYQLSGGQQQRVALARALAPRPDVLLLDEPLSALDAKIRVALRDDIRRIQRELGITTIFVTHDQEEALSISDRVVVMHAGRADQIGTPAEIYNRPATQFVAGFVGHLNLLQAQVAEGALQLAGQSLPLPFALQNGAQVTVALRPEVLALSPRRAGDVALTGRVLRSSFLGSVIRAYVDIGQKPMAVDLFNQAGAALPADGSTAQFWFSPEDLLLLPEDV